MLTSLLRASYFFLLLALGALNSVSAFWGRVIFYQYGWFNADGGKEYQYYIGQTQQCINLSCFNDYATSAKWEGLPQSGNFGGKSRIAFYTDMDCKGTVRDWPTTETNYPQNFVEDGVDNAISSFMIWTDDTVVRGTSLPCPWDFLCCLGD